MYKCSQWFYVFYVGLSHFRCRMPPLSDFPLSRKSHRFHKMFVPRPLSWGTSKEPSAWPICIRFFATSGSLLDESQSKMDACCVALDADFARGTHWVRSPSSNGCARLLATAVVAFESMSMSASVLVAFVDSERGAIVCGTDADADARAGGACGSNSGFSLPFVEMPTDLLVR